MKKNKIRNTCTKNMSLHHINFGQYGITKETVGLKIYSKICLSLA
jgi:hypothetical protein